MVTLKKDRDERFKKITEKEILYLLAVQIDLTISSNDDSEVYDVEFEAALAVLQDMTTGPQEIPW